MAKPLAAIRISDNAFRVLGLPATASQADIVAAARRMRIWTDPAQIPATPWDTPGLGRLFRSRNEIEQAVARLSEPLSRIGERLFWFTDERFTRRGGAGPESTRPASTQVHVAATRHDRALLQLASVLASDPEISDVPRWAAAVTELNRVVTNDDYIDWVLTVEHEGDFEKRAEPNEVGSAMTRLAESITESISTRARDALEGGQYHTCIRLMALLREAAPSLKTWTHCEIDILNCAEDLVVARCDRLCDEIHQKIVWDHNAKPKVLAANRALCQSAGQEIAEAVEPLLDLLKTTAGAESDRMQRAASSAARMMRNLGLGWDWSKRYKDADRVFRRGRELADGTPMGDKISADLRSLWPRLKASQPKFLSSTRDSSSSRWLWVAVVIFVSALRGLMNSPTPRTVVPSYPSINYRAPYQPYHQPPIAHPSLSDRINDDRRSLGSGYPAAATRPAYVPPTDGFGTLIDQLEAQARQRQLDSQPPTSQPNAP
jgi:hypothetical protein